jgi:hypothetical protein
MTNKMMYLDIGNQNSSTGRKLEVATINEKELSAQSSNLKTIVAPTREERRKRMRTRMALAARLRSTDPREGSLKQVVRTLNSSRDGIYFSVPRLDFSEQMRLRIVFPFNSEHDSMSTLEEFGQIVRVDQLPNGDLGVAIALLGTQAKEFSSAKSKSGRRLDESKERRATIRQSFSATATLSEAESGARMTARCSDLSLAGCYVDTINPFTEKSTVQLRLTVGKNSFESQARVVFRQVNFGMGLVFCDLTPDQELLLMQWLASNEEDADPDLVQSVQRPSLSEAPGLTDRALALRLIHLLRSKGNLRESEVSILLSRHLASDEEVGNRPCSDRL